MLTFFIMFGLLASAAANCRSRGIADNLCAVMHDGEGCTDDVKEVVPGGEGKLKHTSFFSNKLRRNDADSLIVRGGCKLEAWDDDEGLREAKEAEAVSEEVGRQRDRNDIDNAHKIVIDQRGHLSRFNKYIDNLDDDYNYKEKISSYRCTCE